MTHSSFASLYIPRMPSRVDDREELYFSSCIEHPFLRIL